MLDIIKLRIEAGDTELLNTFRQIEKHLEAIDNAADGNSKSFKKMTDRFESDLRRVNSQLEKTRSQSKGGSIVGDIISANIAQQAIGYIGQIAKAGFDIATNFEKVKVTFAAAFGDKDLADAYLNQIREFAATTPFEFEKLSASVLKLKNRGFQPTIAELTKLGDVAATTGKDFDQLVEAVLDAQTGEFERLKDFGIKASKANGQVTLSFKGVSKTVQDNEKAIRDAIIAYGELPGVLGVSAAQADTVGGALSNLSDRLAGFAISAGENLSPAIKDAINGLSAFLGTFDGEKILAFFGPIRDQLIPALENLFSTLQRYVLGVTDATDASSLGADVLEGLKKAIALVVDAFVAIIDVSAAVYDKFLQFDNATGILSATFQSLKEALGFVVTLFDEIFKGVSRLALGQEAYNKRIKESVDAEIARGKAAIERKKQDEANAKKLEEQQKQQANAIVASKVAEKADKDRVKSLEQLAKAYESFNDKLEKAKVDSLTGVERIEAERKVAQAELLEKLNLAKKDAEQVKNARGATVAEKKKAAEEIAQITAAAKELEALINKKYDDQILKFAQEEQKKILELNKKTLDEKIKNIEEEGKLKELELSIAEQGNAVYTKEEQVAIKRIELEQRTLEAKRKAFLDAKGISTNSDTNIATLDTTSLNKVDLAELQRQNADIEKIKQDGRNQQFANDLAALNRKEEILTAEVDLIEKSGDGVLSLEEFKEKQILIIKQKALQDEIEIARLRYGPESPQVQGLDVQLKLLTRKIANFNDQKAGKGIEGFLKKQLNISDEDFNLILSKAQELVSAVGSLISQQNELELQQLEERQSILDEKIKQTEDNIKKEQDLKDKGFRNNLEAEQATLAALTAEKQKAAEEEKKLRKDQLTQQLIADEISAASSLALAISQIILQSSKYGPILGLVTAGIGILGMIALFTKYKAATKKLEDGGNLADSGFVSLRGRTDKFGGRGHRIEDSNIVVGGSEFITNEVDSQRYENVLKRVNAGKLRRKPQHEIDSFVKWMDGDALPRVSLPGIPEHQSVYIQNVMANPANKEIFAGSSQENRLLEVVKGMSVEIRSMREELSDLKKITAKRPIHTPIPGGYMETVGNNTTIIKFKQNGND